jgi:hypothetical protein
MNAAIITTVNHNVGDDFVREGILFLLEQYFGQVKLLNIHKHAPVTARKNFEWIRNYHLSRLFDLLPIDPIRDKVLTGDILVQSGAPLYWCHPNNHCADNEWYRPLIQRRYLRVRDRVPFLNLAAGTCQKYGSDGSEFSRCKRCSAYIKDLYMLSATTTVRDDLAKKVLNSLGLEAIALPCPSIYARDQLGIPAEEPRYVCLNYMNGGGHYDFGHNIDRIRWEMTFRVFYRSIKDKCHCVFVCHDTEELKNAERIAPEATKFFSSNYRDYLTLYAHAACGVVNRVHSAFAMASFGRPAFVIGTDTRVRMAEQINLPYEFVENVDLARLLDEYEALEAAIDDYADYIEKIKKNAASNYRKALSVL